MLRGGDVSDIQAFKREGLTVTRISQVTGISRPTVRKYLENKGAPRYSARPKRPGILTPYEPYLKERMAAGVWNGVVLLREIKERGYAGKYTALREYLQPLRKEAQTVAVRRFETPRGKQAQVDWGHLGDVTDEIGASLPLNGFVMTLGNSRAMFADAANDQKLPTFLAMHEAAFAHLGGVPETILYDNCKTVVLGYDDRGEPRFHPTFLDFARYWGFTPKLCRPYRPQTKGKVENGVGYVRKNFLCATDAKNLAELRVKLGIWCAEVAKFASTETPTST
jgi:transposase